MSAEASYLVVRLVSCQRSVFSFFAAAAEAELSESSVPEVQAEALSLYRSRSDQERRRWPLLWQNQEAFPAT